MALGRQNNIASKSSKNSQAGGHKKPRGATIALGKVYLEKHEKGWDGGALLGVQKAERGVDRQGNFNGAGVGPEAEGRKQKGRVSLKAFGWHGHKAAPHGQRVPSVVIGQTRVKEEGGGRRRKQLVAAACARRQRREEQCACRQWRERERQ